MKLIHLDDGPSLEVRELEERERPPIVTVPAYRLRRATRSAATPGGIADEEIPSPRG